MTIDEIITAMTQAKDELGGDYDVRLKVCCGNDCDFLNIESIAYSKIFGLRIEVNDPWWAYKKPK